MTFALLFLLFGFAAGYGARAFMSRRRRAAAREEFWRKHPDIKQLYDR
jgi:hypothetical protein